MANVSTGRRNITNSGDGGGPRFISRMKQCLVGYIWCRHCRDKCWDVFGGWLTKDCGDLVRIGSDYVVDNGPGAGNDII